ncbi:MAG: hypothetical protein WBG17_05275 [Burkholderiaceae bacterium]
MDAKDKVWQELFWQVAKELNCLPSSFPDANDHVLRKARTLTAQVASARNDALEEAAQAAERHDMAGREWIPGSLWDTLSREASARIRALQDLPAAQVTDQEEDADPIRALIADHAARLDENPYCYFELAYTRHTGWMAWLCSNLRESDPNREIIAQGQGDTPDEACSAATTASKGAR